MAAIINQEIPEFSTEAFVNGEFKTITSEDVKGSWAVFMFYPHDFTFVCPTELTKFSSLKDEFDDLDTTVLFCSNDSVYSHKAWCNKSISDGGIGELNFPMLSDKSNKLSQKRTLIAK